MRRCGGYAFAVTMDKLRRYATPGVIIGALGVGFVLLALGAAALFFWMPPLLAANEPAEMALTVIPGPSSTPQPPTASPPPTSTATATISPLLPGEMGVGSYVQVINTGVGLNIRSQPTTSGDVEFLGYDSEVFIVRDGPVEADGFTWWYLVTPVDETRAGWAAATYLEVVANP